MRKISILGSTGSIGKQTLDVVREHKDKFEVVAISANSSIDLLLEQIKEFKPKYVAVYNEEASQKLKSMIPNDINIEVLSGMEGLKTISSLPEIDVLLTAIVGMIGLVPTLEAIKNEKDIALANKETLVCAGNLVMSEAKKNGVKISYTNKYKSYLLDIWPRYVKDVEDYKKFYNELKKKAEIVKKRGIHYGCSDDIALKDMTEFSYNLNSYQYRVSSISQVTEIYNTIINHIRNINREFQYSPDIVGYRIYL